MPVHRGGEVFCTIKGLEALGFGKVVGVAGSKWEIEFFDRPGHDGREVRKVRSTHVTKRNLGANTRVYHYKEATNQWLVGRVIQDHGETVEVRFPNRNDLLIEHEHIFVRWKRPIRDPVEYLSRVITETPMYAYRSEEHTSELQSRSDLVCRLLLEKKKR